MIYEFEADDGERIERNMPMAEAPPLGSAIVVDGKTYRRVASLPPGSPAPVWKPYVSSRLPRNLDGFDCNPQGKPIIHTQAEERRAASMLGWERE